MNQHMVALRQTSRARYYKIYNNIPAVRIIGVGGGAAALLLCASLLSLSAVTSSKAASNETIAETAISLARPSIELLGLGLRFATPKGWTAEDYPQLNGVLLVGPAANDAPKTSWRTRILIEVAKPQLVKDLATLAATHSVSILGPGTEWREIARANKRHAQGFDYGWAESTQRRDPHALRDWRIVIRPKTGDQLIVITISCARAQWDIERKTMDAFIDQLQLL